MHIQPFDPTLKITCFLFLMRLDTQSFQRGGDHPAPEEAPEGHGSPAPEGPGRGSPAPVVIRRARGGRGRGERGRWGGRGRGGRGWGGRGRGGRGDDNVCILSLCSDFPVSLSTNVNGVLLT